MKKPYSQYTKKELLAVGDRKHDKILKKHHRWNTQYLEALGELNDWYEEKLNLIKPLGE